MLANDPHACTKADARRVGHLMEDECHVTFLTYLEFALRISWIKYD